MIMSPATQKLEALKGKRFGNVGKKGKMGQGLFVGSLWKDGGEKEKGLGKEGEEGEAEKKE